MPELRSSAPAKWASLAEAGIAAAGMCIFALFIHSGFPLALVSSCGLLLTALALANFLRTAPSALAVLGLRPASRRLIAYAPLGLAIGVGCGVLYRCTSGAEALPKALHGFALVAALIGATEEIIYRGYVQGRSRAMGAIGAAVFASLCHTAYKCSLFAFPPPGVEVDFCFLAACTFLGGVAFGILRVFSRSVIPPVIAHVIFDVLVYGGLEKAPWWVWR